MPRYRRWTDDEMKNAIDLVLSGGSVYKTRKKYGIPSNTRNHRIENSDPKKPGLKAYLSKSEKNNIVKYVQYMARTGNPVTSTLICETATRLVSCRYLNIFSTFALNSDQEGIISTKFI